MRASSRSGTAVPAPADTTETAGLVEEGAAFARIAGSAVARRVPETASRPLPSRCEVAIIGGGQAGLSIGYHLSRAGVPFVILDANPRIGDSWRNRWHSLRLFTPARFDGLDGMPFPAAPGTFPTKDEMAAYLESYAEHFRFPVQPSVRVDRLFRSGERFILAAGERRFEARQVVVALGSYQTPRVPDFAGELDPRIVQMHSASYRHPSGLGDGDVLLVGAGNSGAEIAMELARAGRRVLIAGRHPGHIPFRVERPVGQVLARVVLRGLFHRVMTVRTPMGRRMRRHVHSHGAPLVRVKPQDLAAAGVVRVPRMAGVRDGRPLLTDGRVLEVGSVIWCTGFGPGLAWIDLPVFGENGEPIHRRGVSEEPGLYFLGGHFIYAASSGMIHGVGRDARHIAGHIAAAARQGR